MISALASETIVHIATTPDKYYQHHARRHCFWFVCDLMLCPSFK
jgi:hypothetical protein